MNNAVFINSVVPNVKVQIEKIIAAQERFHRLQSDIELKIGVLEISENGAKIVVDLEHYDRIAEEIQRNLEEIKEAYEYLVFMKVAEMRAAQPPSHSTHQEDLQLH